jgi:hypothetical protein
MERYNVLGSEQFAFTGRIRFFALESGFCCVVTCCGLGASSGPRARVEPGVPICGTIVLEFLSQERDTHEPVIPAIYCTGQTGVLKNAYRY